MLACSVCVSEDWLLRKPRPPQAERWELGRVTIMLTGYTFDGYTVNSLISNFQDLAS